MRSNTGWMALVLVTFLPHMALAAVLLGMPKNWTVLTEYTDPVTKVRQNVTWNYALEQADEGHVLVITDASGGVDFQVRADLDDSGRMTQASESRTVGQRQRTSTRSMSSEGPVVSPQGLVPLSLLQVPGMFGDRFPMKVTETRQAGGVTFVTAYLLHREGIAFSQAKAQGLVRDDQQETAAGNGLLLYTLKAEDGSTVLRQVWTEKGLFWLSDHTDARRSWRLP